MLVILIKASVIIGVGWLFYKVFLQQESFFALNRYYLLTCMCLAFLFPYLSIPKMIENQGYLNEWLDQITHEDSDEGVDAILVDRENIVETPIVSYAPMKWVQQHWTFILYAIYLLGVVILSTKFLKELGSILLLVRRCKEKIHEKTATIIPVDAGFGPCSFFNYIFISQNDYDPETYAQIVSHEKIHIKQKHSYDLLIAELAVIFLWFNPFAWFFRKEIEKNIEYQTDSILLHSREVSKSSYQTNLLLIASHNKAIDFTSNYNQSLLKQRILMMNAKKSNPSSLWKYIMLAPLFLGMCLILNKPLIGQLPLADNYAKTIANTDQSDSHSVSAGLESLSPSRKLKSLYLVINANTDESILAEFKEKLSKYGVVFEISNLSVKKGKIASITANLLHANGNQCSVTKPNMGTSLSGSAVFYFEQESGIAGCSPGGFSDKLSDYGKEIIQNNLNGLFVIYDKDKIEMLGSVGLPEK